MVVTAGPAGGATVVVCRVVAGVGCSTRSDRTEQAELATIRTIRTDARMAAPPVSRKAKRHGLGSRCRRDHHKPDRVKPFRTLLEQFAQDWKLLPGLACQGPDCRMTTPWPPAPRLCQAEAIAPERRGCELLARFRLRELMEMGAETCSDAARHCGALEYDDASTALRSPRPTHPSAPQQGRPPTAALPHLIGADATRGGSASQRRSSSKGFAPGARSGSTSSRAGSRPSAS